MLYTGDFLLFLPSASKPIQHVTLIKSISGIRGTIGGKTGDNLTPVDVVKFAAAYGTVLKKKRLHQKSSSAATPRPSGEMVKLAGNGHPARVRYRRGRPGTVYNPHR